MKFFVIFMTGLMLITGFNLCSSQDWCNEKAEVNVLKSVDSQPDTEMMCSPFCNCARCPFSILLPAKTSVKPVVAGSVKRFNPSSIFVFQRIITPVWQPPRCV